VINDSTINKLDEAINEVDHVTFETSIQEKGIKSFKVMFYTFIYTITCTIFNYSYYSCNI